VADNVTSLSLLERLRDRSDETAWRRFHDLYSPLIQRWLMRRGVNQEDADDVGQEVMRLALTQLPEFQHSGRVGALRAWLRQVVANRLKTFWRQKNRGGARGGDDCENLAEQLADPKSQLSLAWDEEYHRGLCERLLELAGSEFQQQTMEAFRRVTLDAQKPTEVAKSLGISINAVRIAQSRVMRRLRELGEGLLE
jgi:RNA polymerase sigma-70 factor (ECF subfamily)